MRRLWWFLAALVGVAACDDFTAGPAADAGANDGGTTDGNDAAGTEDSGHEEAGDGDGGGDGGLTDAPFNPETSVADTDGLYVNCPRTAPVSRFESHTTYAIADPPADDDRDYPFGVVTDTNNVYWVSTRAKPTDTTENGDAYNGVGKRGRIHRAPKSPSKTLTWKEALLVQTDQPYVTDVALDGKYVYWAVGSNGAVQMRRVLRDCQAPCPPEDAGEPVNTQAIVHLRRAAPGVLAGLTRDGVAVVFTTATAKWEVTSLSTRSGGFAVRNGDVFASRIDDDRIGRVALGSPSTVTDKYATVSPQDGGAKGIGLLTTDCQSLFAFRDKSVWRLDIATGKAFAPWTETDVIGAYGLFADAYFVYVGSADLYGLHAISIATKETLKVADGSYWRVTADESGVYAGEHTNSGPDTGAMRRFK